ncbi:MAG TPA: hypothetical protein VM580_33535 [Labilithrix sp.]|nr:hypothetical protein [Labilithrix sp.]
MALDTATRQLALVCQREVRHLWERATARADRGEVVRYDSASGIATWETESGEVIGRWYAERMGTYVVRDRILRWSWAGRSSISAASHAELVVREGETRAVPQFAMSVVGDLEEDEAMTLAALGVVVARGEGIDLQRTHDEITFIGLFDTPRPREGEPVESTRYSLPAPRSVPPPPRPVSRPPASSPSRRPPAPVGAPYRSLPPIREIYAPRAEPRQALRSEPQTTAHESQRRVREPARSLFLPLATVITNVLAHAVPGYEKGLFVLTVDPASEPEGKGRLVVFLVASDASGALHAIDVPAELLDAAARLVEADRVDGNGTWRKLSARISPKPDGGATLNVDVL